MEKIQKIRNELYNSLPTGEISSWTINFVDIIKEHIEKLDSLNNKNISTFLKEKIEVIDEFQNKTEITRLDRMTELYVKNKFDFSINGWGFVEPADLKINPYGAFGLDVEEAMELNKYESFILGICFVEDPENKEIWFKNNIFNKMEEMLKTKRKEVKKKATEKTLQQ